MSYRVPARRTDEVVIPYESFGFPPRAAVPVLLACLAVGLGLAFSRPHHVTCARSANEAVVLCESTRALGKDRFWLEPDERLARGSGKRAACVDRVTDRGARIPASCAVDDPVAVARDVNAYAAGRSGVYERVGPRQKDVLAVFAAIAGVFVAMAGWMVLRRRTRFTIHLSRRDNTLLVERTVMGVRKDERIDLEGDERVEIESMPPPAADDTFAESAPRRLVLVGAHGERTPLTPFLAATKEQVRVAVELEHALHEAHHGPDHAHEPHVELAVLPGSR